MNDYFQIETIHFSEQTSRSAVLIEMAELLIEKGYVKESYKQAILEREKIFPTGLLTEFGGVALPHADSKHVLSPIVCIAKLKESITFHEMAVNDELVPVQLVFMLALQNPEDQLDMLQLLIQMIQNEEVMQSIAVSNKSSEILDAIHSFSLLGKGDDK